MTPIRVVCQNTLNLALDTARRCWSAKHTDNIQNRIHEAQETLGLAHCYEYLFALAGEPTPRLAVVIVFPTPPFLAPIKIVLPIWFFLVF